MSASAGDREDTVLVVTADPEFAAACERHLASHADVSVTTVDTVTSALDTLDETQIECIVSDHDLPDTDGIAFLEAVRAESPSLPFVLFTSEGNERVASRAISAGVTDYLIKERHADEWERLARLVADAIAYYHTHVEFTETETRAKALLDAAHDAIAVVREERVVFLNESGVELFGVGTKTAATDIELSERLTTDSPETFLDHLAAVRAGERTLDRREGRVRQSSGTESAVEITATSVKWDSEPSVLLVIRDISERRQSEISLRRFERAVEAAGHAVYITDPEGTITYVNPAFERITGYDSEEAVGETPRILKSGEMPQEYYEQLWTTVLDGEVWEEEIIDRRASGELYYAHQTIAPVKDQAGEVAALVAIQTETTERKEREERLRYYEQAIEGASDLIAAIDTDYQFLFANPAYREFHGIGPEEDITERRLQSVLDEETVEMVTPLVERALEGESIQYQTKRHRADRPDRTLDIRYHPLESADGEIQGVVATMRDVSEEKERDRQLMALDRLLRHNIHNELNLIIGYAETIAATGEDHSDVSEDDGDVREGDRDAREDAAETASPAEETTEDTIADGSVPDGAVVDMVTAAEKIEDAGRRLLRQADKQREIVKLLSDPSPTKHLDLTRIVNEVREGFEAQSPDVRFHVETPESVPLTTTPEVELAITELVENAIVHAERESPEVTLTVTDDGERVTISVTDEGPSIPEEERQLIEGAAEIDSLLHSSGMGLWLVNAIVTRAGGKVVFADRDSGGNVVTLVVPRE
jgi:PAS domain S-box-containing protein